MTKSSWMQLGTFRIVNYEKDTFWDDTQFLLEIEESYVYCYEGKKYTSDKGDVSDGASIPDVFKKLAGDNFGSADPSNLKTMIKFINKRGSYVPAAFIHDKLCYLGLSGNPVCSWEDAHKIFYNAMLDNGVPKFCGFLGLGGAWTKYQAVRFGMILKKWDY